VTRSAELEVKIVGSASAVSFYAIPALTEFGDATLFMLVTWGERDTEVIMRKYSDQFFGNPVSEIVLNYEVP
jgi:hypothetical protein